MMTRKRRLCAHADSDGQGMHWLEPGETCPRLAPPAPAVPEGRYADAAGDADNRLDDELAYVRRSYDAGDIDAAEAAVLRCELLEAHIATIQLLRHVYFGEDGADGT